METRIKIALGVLAGFGLGAVAVQTLHAQAKPPAYVISAIEVRNAHPYAREYGQRANKGLCESGQKRLASGGRTIAIAGMPPASRVVVSVFDSLEKAQAAYTSPAYLEASTQEWRSI